MNKFALRMTVAVLAAGLLSGAAYADTIVKNGKERRRSPHGCTRACRVKSPSGIAAAIAR